MGNTRIRCIKTNGFHGLVKALAIFGFVDGIGIGANHFYAILLEHAVLGQIQCAVQSGLTTHGGQQCVRLFLSNNMLNRAPLNRLDISRIGHGGISHDRCRVGVHQDYPETLFAQGFTGLSAGVVKLTGLTNNNWSCTQDENAFYVSSFWHVFSESD